MRDFNNLLSHDEKKGHYGHPNWLINGFREDAIDSKLKNIPMTGYPYTLGKKAKVSWVR